MKVIGIISPTHGFHSVKVDDEDFEILKHYTWCLMKYKHSYYAYCNTCDEYGQRHTTRMHKMIMRDQLFEGCVVDHINGNGLDNRRCNLRVVDRSTNSRNSKLSEANTSGYTGVHLDKQQQKWIASIYDNNKQRIYRSFAASKYGFNEAKEMAIKVRQQWEQEFGYINR